MFQFREYHQESEKISHRMGKNIWKLLSDETLVSREGNILNNEKTSNPI